MRQIRWPLEALCSRHTASRIGAPEENSRPDSIHIEFFTQLNDNGKVPLCRSGMVRYKQGMKLNLEERPSLESRACATVSSPCKMMHRRRGIHCRLLQSSPCVICSPTKAIPHRTRTCHSIERMSTNELALWQQDLTRCICG